MLQAIAESVNENEFDAIIEGAAILIEENEGMSMDEAVQVSAAMLYNEDAIGDAAFSVTNAVIDEFANNIPAPWDQTLALIAESVDEETFDAIMTEAAKDAMKNLKNGIEVGAFKARKGLEGGLGKLGHLTGVSQAATGVKQSINMKNPHGNAKTVTQKSRNDNLKDAAPRLAGTAAVGALGALGSKALIDKAKEKKAAKAAEEAKLSNKVKAKLEEGKEKAGELVDKAKEKIGAKNEDASDFLSLADLR